MSKKVRLKTSYGIAELYGERFDLMMNARRVALLDIESPPECPHLASFPALAPVRKKKPVTKCHKNGGICSLRAFDLIEGEQRFGPITITCPTRFQENGAVFRSISRTLLGVDDASLAKEITFLMRSPDQESADAKEDVGRIDLVLVNAKADKFDWCAVELQAVYFSGGAMSKDFSAIRAHTENTVPMPGASRRPDFRSSGPKRLMPQLQIKVPTLRRWGKKMAVVVDQPFFDSLGEMDHVADISNADIAWFIVAVQELDEPPFSKLEVKKVRFTTLERAVEGLTAGVPTTLSDFETRIRNKLRT